jgi:uncharacterized DUF497 family protein
VKITFDSAKRVKNLAKHGLDLADAAEVFAGYHADAPDKRFDYGEPLVITAGWLRGRMVVLVWTTRDDERRIISMRYCHAKEEKRWKAHIEDQS